MVNHGIKSHFYVLIGVFSVITFPFLFSVMFGDAGHGLLLALFALFMIVRERHLINATQGSEVGATILFIVFIIMMMMMTDLYSAFSSEATDVLVLCV